jgi:hypothetical protein
MTDLNPPDNFSDEGEESPKNDLTVDDAPVDEDIDTYQQQE